MPSNKPRPLNDPKEGDKAKVVDFLLDLAEAGPEADIYQVAREREINDPDKVLERFAGLIGAERKYHHDTFPNEVLKYYNAGLSPQGDLLKADDIQELSWLADRYAERLMNKARPQQSYSTMSGNNQPQPPPYQQQPPYQYQYQPYQPPPNPYNYNAPPPPQSIVLPPPSEEAEQEAGLLEYILTSIYNPRPHLVPRFLDMFKRMYDKYVQNPHLLYILMKQNFSESTAQVAYQQWASLRSGNTNTDAFAGVGMGMVQPGTNTGTTAQIPGMPYVQHRTTEDERWDKMDRMMQRHMQMKYMEMMTGQNNQQQQQAPPGTAYMIEDILDAHGRPTGAKRQIPVPIGQAQTQQESKLAEIMLQSSQQRENILLQKLEQPNTWLEKMASAALQNHAQTVNPFEGFKQILALNNELNQNKPQEQTKSLDALSKEIDAKLALTQLNMQERKEQREFEREMNQEKSAAENAKEYIDAIKEVVGKGIQPLVSQFASGLAGQQQQQVQAQQAQITEQQQQQMVMQQQAAEAQRIREQALHEAQLRQQQKVMQQQMMQQHQNQNQVPIDEQISGLTDGQLEQEWNQFDQGLRQHERVYKKLSAERAKRRMMRGGGIGARVQQQQVYANPPPPEEQSFEERIKAGQQAQEEETGVASESMEDNTKSTPGAVTTELTPDDKQAMMAGKDGIAGEPMQFGVSGSPTAKPEEMQGDSEPPLEEEEEEEYEEEEEQG